MNKPRKGDVIQTIFDKKFYSVEGTCSHPKEDDYYMILVNINGFILAKDVLQLIPYPKIITTAYPGGLAKATEFNPELEHHRQFWLGHCIHEDSKKR